jgi:parvulin-like peptidyl-prolyl isomerase
VRHVWSKWSRSLFVVPLLALGLGACSTAGSALDSTVLKIGDFRYTRGELEKAIKKELGKDGAKSSNGTYDVAVVSRVLSGVVEGQLPIPPTAAGASEAVNRQLRDEYNVAVSALFDKELKARKLKPAPRTAEIEQASEGNVDPGQWAVSTAAERDRIITVNQQIKGLIDGATAAQGTPEQYYKAHANDFSQVCASHILVKTQGEADKVRARITGGEDFAKVAKETSQDPGSGAQGGDLGCADPGQYAEEFANATRTLPLNELSQPVKTQFGFHIIVVKERKTLALADALPQIQPKLQQAASTELQTTLGPKLEKIDKVFSARQQELLAKAAAATAGNDKKRGELLRKRAAKIHLDARYGTVGPDGAIVAPGPVATAVTTPEPPVVPQQ